MGVLGENQKSLRIKLKVQKKLRQKKTGLVTVFRYEKLEGALSRSTHAYTKSFTNASSIYVCTLIYALSYKGKLVNTPTPIEVQHYKNFSINMNWTFICLAGWWLITHSARTVGTILHTG